MPAREQQRGMIKALPTWFDGVRFRSRLEAQWAVFFTVAGIPWRYEESGYKMPGGCYRPDFRLYEFVDDYPHIPTYFEVKGAEPPSAALDLMAKFAEERRCCLYLAVGDIPRFQRREYYDDGSLPFRCFGGYWQGPETWCYQAPDETEPTRFYACHRCGSVGLYAVSLEVVTWFCSKHAGRYPIVLPRNALREARAFNGYDP